MLDPTRRGLTAIPLTALLAALLTASPGEAINFRSGDRVAVAADETVDDDLYAAAERVVVDGRIAGDLVAVGKEVVVNGVVEGDLIAAGQTVVVRGRVGDDARIAGMALNVGSGASIGDDVVAAGFSFESEPGSGIAGSVVLAGYQALLAGEIGEAVTGGVAGLDLQGSVDGDVRVEVEGDGGPRFFMQFFDTSVTMPSVPPGLTVGEEARVGGVLSYSSPSEGRIADGASLEGGVDWREIEKKPEEEAPPEAAVEDEAAPREEDRAAAAGRAALRHLRRLATLLIVGLILVGAAPRWTGAQAETASSRFLACLLWGIVGLVAVPVVMFAVVLLTILLAIVSGMLSLPKLVGLSILLGLFTETVLALGFWIVVAFLAPVIAALAAGRWLLGRAAPARAAGRFLPLLLGLIVLGVALAIPVLGKLLGLAVVLVGLGALCVRTFGSLRRRRPRPAAETA